MSVPYETPTDWKSETWWRNRPLEERLWHIHPPLYVEKQLPEKQPGGLRPMEPIHQNYYVYGDHSFVKSVKALEMVRNHVQMGCSGRWIEADDYIEMLKDSFEDGGLPLEYSTPYLIKYIKGVYDVLVLDGLGEERSTDFAQHEIGTLIKKRFERGKLTIITSSLKMDEAKARYPRIAPVISEFQLVQVGAARPSFESED